MEGPLTRGFMEAGYKENKLDTQRNKTLNSSTTSEDPNTTNIQADTLVLLSISLRNTTK